MKHISSSSRIYPRTACRRLDQAPLISDILSMASLDLEDVRPCHSLFDLPLEIREIIYAHLLKATYTDTLSSSMAISYDHSAPRTASHRLAILQTSWQVNNEALPILYRESAFRFSFNKYLIRTPDFDRTPGLVPESSILTPPTQLATKSAALLQNVELQIDMRHHLWRPDNPISTQLLKSLDALSMPGLRRESCLIELRYDWSHIRFASHIVHLSTAFLEAMQNLTSFRLVNIQITILPSPSPSPYQYWPPDAQDPYPGSLIEGITKACLAFTEYLEPILGPSDFQTEGSAFCLVYRPAMRNPGKDRVRRCTGTS